jgi:hypothetical protein
MITRTSSVSSTLFLLPAQISGWQHPRQPYIDGTPIASHAHSPLPLTNLSPPIYFPLLRYLLPPLHLVCTRLSPSPALALCLSLGPHRPPLLYIPPSSTKAIFLSLKNWILSTRSALFSPWPRSELLLSHSTTICAVLQHCLLFKQYKRSPREMERVCRASKMTFVCQDESCLRVVGVRIVVGGGCAYECSGRCRWWS